MYMRGNLFIPVILAVIMSLSSCSQSINSSAEELCMYSWESVAENGNAASLLFCETKAYLRLQTHDKALHIHGIFAVSDERLLICDDVSGMNYTFGYTLYGDRVELSSNGGIISLNKQS